MIIAWLKNNISVSLLAEMNSIQNSLFDKEGDNLVLKGINSVTENSNFTNDIKKIAQTILESGPCEWKLLYERVAAHTAEYGIPDPHEVKEALSEVVTFDGNRCIAFIKDN